MKMDGPCALYPCVTDGKLENVSFFFGFSALVGLLPAGVCTIFDICSVYFYPSINITRIKGVRQYAKSKWLCDQCKEPDTQEHLLTCVGYSVLKIGRDLSKDKEQVEFYRQIVKLRSRDCTGT